MKRRDAISWVLSVVTGLRLSQAKTLRELVAAAWSVLPEAAGFCRSKP